MLASVIMARRPKTKDRPRMILHRRAPPRADEDNGRLEAKLKKIEKAESKAM
jgi:hypothetical protein